MKETTMSFRVEQALREEFHDAAKLTDQPAANVLRQLMRQYVARARDASARGELPIVQLPEDEQLRRGSAVAFASASVALEGFAVSPDVQRHADRFIRGEIDLPALVKGPGRDQSPER